MFVRNLHNRYISLEKTKDQPANLKMSHYVEGPDIEAANWGHLQDW